ncbi:MAG: Hsp20/alpha crystallin family protein [Caulobacteraceae bacterium]
MNIGTNIPVRRDDGRFLWRAPGVDSLQREIDRVFDAFSGGFLGGNGGTPAPMVDVVETDKEVKISCELPGLEEKDIELSLADDVLTLRGEKRTEHDETVKGYRHLERSYGAFARSIELPAHVDATKARATMKKGVLKVVAPKTESEHARRIEIRPEA